MKSVSAEEAVAMIPNGATVMIGGFMGVGTPERLLDELVRQKKNGLTIIANDAAVPGRGIGKLVDQLATVVQPLKCTGDGECQQQSRYAEDSSLDRAKPNHAVGAFVLSVSQAQVPAPVQRDERANEEERGNADGEKHEDHWAQSFRSEVPLSVRYQWAICGTVPTHRSAAARRSCARPG
jgi:hypothetical protein